MGVLLAAERLSTIRTRGYRPGRKLLLPAQMIVETLAQHDVPPACPARRRRSGARRRLAGGMTILDAHRPPAGVRAPHARGTRHPLRAAVVHRRARLPQVVGEITRVAQRCRRRWY